MRKNAEQDDVLDRLVVWLDRSNVIGGEGKRVTFCRVSFSPVENAMAGGW